MSIEVLLNDPNISVIGPPASIDIQLDVGPTGQRGSQIYVGSSDPNVSSPTTNALANDLFFRQISSTEMDIYQYLPDGIGGFQWEIIYTLSSFDTENVVLTTDPRLSDTRIPTDNSVTSAKIVNGSIVDADINSGAAISQSKISGLVASLASKANLSGATFIGPVTFLDDIDIISPSASVSTGVRDITISTSTPTGGNDGDVWLQYTV